MSMPPWIAKQIHQDSENAKTDANRTIGEDRTPSVSESAASGGDTCRRDGGTDTCCPGGFAAIGTKVLTSAELQALRRKHSETADAKTTKLPFFANLFGRK